MSDIAECGYLRTRLERETELARAAANGAAATSHGELARLYAERIEELCHGSIVIA